VLTMRDVRAEACREDPPPQSKNAKGARPRVLPLVGFWMLTGYLAQAMEEHAVSRAMDSKITCKGLPDFVHDRVTQVRPMASFGMDIYAPDALVLGCFLPLLALVLERVWMQNQTYFARIVRRILFLHSLFIFLHACCCIATIMPLLGSTQSASIIAFLAPPLIHVGQIELIIITSFLVFWSDLSPATKIVTLIMGPFTAFVKIASGDLYSIDVVIEICYCVPFILLHREELIHWLKAQPSKSGLRSWKIFVGPTTNGDELLTLCPREKRVFGRQDLPSRWVSRAHLLVSHDPTSSETIKCECIGQAGVIVHDETKNLSWDVSGGSSFNWSTDYTVEVPASEGEAYFLTLKQM